MNPFRHLIACLAVLAPAVLAAGQTAPLAASLVGPTTTGCSPAPCVLPPTQVSSGARNVFDAPVVADPADPAHLIVGSADFNCSESGLGFHLSTDAGANWDDLVCMVPLLTGGQEYQPDNFPILGYDHNGVAYIGGFYINNNGRSSYGFEGFEKSSDGVNWSTPAPAVISQNYDPDYCWMAVDTSPASPYVNSVYVSCVMVALKPPSTNLVIVAHSTDGGNTWQQVNVAPPQNSDAQDLNTALTVGQNGTVYVTWMYCLSDPHECSNNMGYMVFAKSGDGGNTWSKPSLVATVSLGQGIPNTNIGAQNTPAISVDNSDGPYSGSLYMVMYNWTGTFMQVQVVRSTDRGVTWSRPVPVAPGITHDQFFPWISVSPAGMVGVSWLDRRNDPKNINYQAFAAISANGGSSFQPNVQLTTAFSNPEIGGVNTMGNYTGDTWDGPNYFIAAWMDSSNGVNFQDVVGGIRLK